MSTAMKMTAILMSIAILMSTDTTMIMIPLEMMKPKPQAAPGKMLLKTEETSALTKRTGQFTNEPGLRRRGPGRMFREKKHKTIHITTENGCAMILYSASSLLPTIGYRKMKLAVRFLSRDELGGQPKKHII